jgi:hypothetical protein
MVVLKFFSLVTGEILTRRKWTELPVPSELIQRIKENVMVDTAKEDELYNSYRRGLGKSTKK